MYYLGLGGLRKDSAQALLRARQAVLSLVESEFGERQGGPRSHLAGSRASVAAMLMPPVQESGKDGLDIWFPRKVSRVFVN